jgi:hypothetical protein
MVLGVFIMALVALEHLSQLEQRVKVLEIALMAQMALTR